MALLARSEQLPANPHALIIFNPTAGQAEALADELAACQAILSAAGWQVDMTPTQEQGDGTRIAQAAAKQGYHVVIAAGGDGTINEVINGLVGTQTALAALPIGTMNVWVRELGLPLQPRAAAETLLYARVRPIDLGRAGQRYFLLMAGVGFDAAVVNQVRSHEKRLLGPFAYVLRALEVASSFQGARVRLTIDGRKLRRRMILMVIGNSQLYGGVIKITARASIDDGLLDLCIIKGNSLLSAPMRVFSIISGRHMLDPEIEYHRARTIKIESNQRLPVQVDGDHIGDTPMTVEAVPGAIYALLPPDLPTDLLTEAGTPRPRAWRRILGWLGRRRPG